MFSHMGDVDVVKNLCKHTSPNCNPCYVTHLQMWVEPRLQSRLWDLKRACKQLVWFVSGLSAALVSCPPCVPPCEKWSGEQSQILGLIPPKLGKTNEIARLLLIT